MKWLHELSILIYEREQIRIKIEIFSLKTLEHRGWSFSTFKTLALGIGIAKIHLENVIMVSNGDVAETTLKQIDKTNHTVFENCLGLLQLRQFSAQIR